MSSKSDWCSTLVVAMIYTTSFVMTWWRHQMETFSALLAFCAGNSPVNSPSEFPAQRPVTRSFEVFFDLRPNKRLSKQSWGWWSETPSSSLWRHRNGALYHDISFNLHVKFILLNWSFEVFYVEVDSWYNTPGNPLAHSEKIQHPPHDIYVEDVHFDWFNREICAREHF